MKEPSLHDCYVRLDGARDDLKALEDDITVFLKDQVYSVLREEDAESGDRLLGVRIARPPADWGRRAGHIVGDLRSALDYLVYQLAWLDSGAPQDGTQFPICDASEAFQVELKKGRLVGLDPAHVEAIKGCQPFEASGGMRFRQIRCLSNPDKHRHLNSAVTDDWPPFPPSPVP